MGGGLCNTQQLSDKPFTATAELNEWRQPAPGHYRLYVVSYRVWRPPDPGEATPYGHVSLTLRSNTIEFEIIKGVPIGATSNCRTPPRLTGTRLTTNREKQSVNYGF